MIIDRKNVEDTFKKYTDNYDTSDEKIKLKVDHTYRVAAHLDLIKLIQTLRGLSVCCMI